MPSARGVEEPKSIEVVARARIILLGCIPKQLIEILQDFQGVSHEVLPPDLCNLIAA